MTFTFSGRRTELTEEMKDYAVRKLEKLEKFFVKETKASLVFSEERETRIAEITLHHGGMVFRAEERTKDFLASIDGAISIIERQIRKNKTKLEKRLRDGAFERELTGAISEEAFHLVRHKKFEVKNMTTEEAILQMEMIGHQFFMFKNSEEGGRVAVVYRRAAGGYGLIEEE